MSELLMSEILGRKGIYKFLDCIYESNGTITSIEMENLIDEIGLSEDIFSDLTSAGLFMGSADGFYVSSLGKKVTLLLKAVNGKEDLSEVFRKLAYLYPQLRPYELLTEDITNYFVDCISSGTDFIRIYICSPWIRLERDYLEKIKQAVMKARLKYVNLEILVITKPREGYNNWRASEETFEVLRGLGAKIVTNRSLHAKLYMSEPGPHGGIHYAIFGSENLTGRRNIELGIKIQNDNELLRKLTDFFISIQQRSKIEEA